MDESLASAVASVPPGRWGMAVSGGADSVALLRLLQTRADLSLHVVHLNHELRGQESDTDAEFVANLARRMSLPSTIERRSAIEKSAFAQNPSEQYRRVRLALYRKVIETHSLDGVLLAHHRDDQVETVLQRLLRGSGYRGLCGMGEVETIAGIEVRRPLLNISGAALRDYLNSTHQSWREDSSNSTEIYHRNRLRAFLRDHMKLAELLLAVMQGCRGLKMEVDSLASNWPEQVVLRARLPQAQIVEEQSIRHWLARGGVPLERINPQLIGCVESMIRDAAIASRTQLPGGKNLMRRGGTLRLI